MSCLRPLEAYRIRLSGEVILGTKGAGRGDKLELPCARCIGCKLDKRKAWAIRIMHESQLYDSSVFVTLTYDDEHLPASLSLEYSDFQCFMRRLRKEVVGSTVGPDGGRPVRFFVSGEYGARGSRPHWHAILFNCWFKDSVRFVNDTLRSKQCEDLWRGGDVVIGSVTSASAAYVAGYTMKKVHGPRARLYYEDVVNVRTGEVSRRRPEFVRMSLKPGIGAWWYRKFAGDMFPNDIAVMDGKRCKVPRYYWNRFQLDADPGLVEELAYDRYLRAMEQRGESTPERRAVREEDALRRETFYGERKL